MCGHHVPTINLKLAKLLWFRWSIRCWLGGSCRPVLAFHHRRTRGTKCHNYCRLKSNFVDRLSSTLEFLRLTSVKAIGQLCISIFFFFWFRINCHWSRSSSNEFNCAVVLNLNPRLMLESSMSDISFCVSFFVGFVSRWFILKRKRDTFICISSFEDNMLIVLVIPIIFCIFLFIIYSMKKN